MDTIKDSMGRMMEERKEERERKIKERQDLEEDSESSNRGL